MATVNGGFHGQTSLREQRAKVEIIVRMDDMIVQGTVHLRPDPRRLSDVLEGILRDERLVVPMTDVEVRMDGADEVKKLPLMLLVKSRIQAIGLTEHHEDL